MTPASLSLQLWPRCEGRQRNERGPPLQHEHCLLPAGHSHMKGSCLCNPPGITPPNNAQLKERQRPSIKHRPGLMRGTCYDLLPPTLPSAPLISPRELFQHSPSPFFYPLIWEHRLFYLCIPFHLRFTWGRGRTLSSESPPLNHPDLTEITLQHGHTPLERPGVNMKALEQFQSLSSFPL